MSHYLNTTHILTFLHNRPLSMVASNKNPKTVQALSALMGLVGVPHKDTSKVKTGLLDVVHPHLDFVAISVFAEGVDDPDSDATKPEFVVMFVESGRMLEMLALREPQNRPELVTSSETLPFIPSNRSLMMFRTTSLNGTTNYVITPTNLMTLTEVVVASLVDVEFSEKKD